MRSLRFDIDRSYLLDILRQLLETPSPAGYTDQVVHLVASELRELGVPFELTRRGAIRATVAGRSSELDRAIVSHVDTLGAQVISLKPTGRLAVRPIGNWSSRFAEGARCTVFTDRAAYRGSILPLKASGHRWNEDIDRQPVTWDNVEIRVDEHVEDRSDLVRYGFNIGDFVAIDPNVEITESGFINSRHLDDKAGVAAMLAATRALRQADVTLPVEAHLLFTISEEVGSGASAGLHGDVAEMVSVDNGVVAQDQNSREFGVTVAMGDMTGPFDFHLTRRLIDLCSAYGIPHHRDVFRFYRSDSASALDAGNDIRTALICFGVDSSHGYERTHVDALVSVSELICAYMLSEPVVRRDTRRMSSIEGFPSQPVSADDYEDEYV